MSYVPEMELGAIQDRPTQRALEQLRLGLAQMGGASVVDFKGSVASSSALPVGGNVDGDAWITRDTGHLWVWNGTAWTDAGAVAVTGPAGPPGATGPPGPPGAGGSDAAYVHTQSPLAQTWTVNHPLGKYPAVSVIDSGGNVLLADVHYVNPDSLTVTFAAPSSGKVYLS